MSILPIEEALRYSRTRFPANLYLPLAFFLCAAALAGGRALAPLDLTAAFVLACGLLFQFRLWDDLSDREQDRLEHPERVLTQTNSVTFFRALIFITFLLNLALIAASPGPPRRLELFLLGNALFLLWYRWLRKLCRNEIARSHLVLLRYPIFVYLLSGDSFQGRGMRLQLAMLLVYLCFCVYELLHDARLDRTQGARKVLAIEMFALGAVPSILAVTLGIGGGTAALMQAIIAAIGGFFLAALFVRHRTGIRTKFENYTVFIVGFIQVLTFLLGGGL